MLASGGQNELGALRDPKAALGAGRRAEPTLRERERSLRNPFLSGWVQTAEANLRTLNTHC